MRCVRSLILTDFYSPHGRKFLPQQSFVDIVRRPYMKKPIALFPSGLTSWIFMVS